MKRLLAICPLLAVLLVVGNGDVAAQGVTTGQIRGLVADTAGNPIPGVRVTAVHVPSNTTYGSTSRADGRYTIPGMRVGGPYTVTAVLVGFQRSVQEGLTVTLGNATDVDFRMSRAALLLEDITVFAQSTVFSSTRTGAATAISQEALEVLPTVSGRIEDFTRLTPQVRGTSFAGVDNRLNNMTVDGSYFNNSFGLAGQPGDRTGVAPISMDAIEQVQVNVAPFDVRQGNFVGAGVNTVTKSGTNEFQGSLYYRYRDEGMVGTTARGLDFDPGTFKFDKIGARLGGPIIKDKLFFFVSYEDDGITQPGTLFRANEGGETAEGNVTRVLRSDLDELSSFLATNFGYETGPYQGYDFETPSERLLARLDWNVSDRHKFSLRYNMLNSFTDVLASNSSSLGFGNRRTSPNALNFQNTNYQILENLRSVVGELNSQLGDNMANSLIIGYNESDESRDTRGGAFFPMVDVLQDGTTYTTFGFEPFSPNNELRYNNWQLQNNLTMYGNQMDWTFGVSLERYESENVFFPGSQSAYVYNSLDDFYTDANDYLDNPNRTTSPVELRRFQVRYSNIPGLDKPVQPLEVFYAGVYAQNQWRPNDNLELTLGLRFDRPSFGETGFTNAEANAMTFEDETGAVARYRTEQLPDANILFSPRLGFNWDVKGDRSTQLRGGTGVFTGRPAYVWISNQVGENGVLTGFEQIENTNTRPWNPDPNHYKPTDVTGDPAASYGLAFTDPDFKFPQVWRTNVAVDQEVFGGWVGTAEFLYSRDVNGVYYINANLDDPDAAYVGADDRPRWTDGNRINSNVTSAVVLKNQNVGTSWNIGASLEKAFNNGFFAKVAYNYGVAKNTVDAGSVAFGSWNNNQHSGDPNNPGLGYAATSPGHRMFAALSYRKDWFSFGATTLSLFLDGFTQGNTSYVFSGDFNGDGGTSNDLIYIPRNTDEMHFEEFTANETTFTVAEQEAAFESYIQQDDYLSSRRGQYAERGGLFLPMVWRADLSIVQDLFTRVGGKLNNLQIRLDILNFTNLVNSDWGVGQRTTASNGQLLIARPAGDDGQPRYRLRNIGSELVSKTFEHTSGLNDVFRIQLGLRYTFN